MPILSARSVVVSFVVVLLAYAALLLGMLVLKDVGMFIAGYLVLPAASAACGIAVHRDARIIEGLGKGMGIKVFGRFKPINWCIASFLLPIVAVPIYIYVRRRALRRLGLAG
jgi:hypothetical protein